LGDNELWGLITNTDNKETEAGVDQHHRSRYWSTPQTSKSLYRVLIGGVRVALVNHSVIVADAFVAAPEVLTGTTGVRLVARRVIVRSTRTAIATASLPDIATSAASHSTDFFQAIVEAVTLRRCSVIIQSAFERAIVQIEVSADVSSNARRGLALDRVPRTT